MKMLMERADALGIEFQQLRIENISVFYASIHPKFNFIINCGGLECKNLFCDEKVTPYRGVLVRCWKTFKILQGLTLLGVFEATNEFNQSSNRHWGWWGSRFDVHNRTRGYVHTWRSMLLLSITLSVVMLIKLRHVWGWQVARFKHGWGNWCDDLSLS